MSISKLIKTNDLDDAKMQAWDEMVPVIMTSGKMVETTPDVAIANTYKGDFIGMLLSLDIPRKYHYILTIINMKTYNSYDGVSSFYIIPSDYLSTLYDTYVAGKK